MKTVTEKSITSFGVQESQYFQGDGLAYTSYVDIAIGFGWTEYEAIEDALDLLAERGWETDGIKNDGNKTVTVHDVLSCNGNTEEEIEASDSGFYVSIKVK